MAISYWFSQRHLLNLFALLAKSFLIKSPWPEIVPLKCLAKWQSRERERPAEQLALWLATIWNVSIWPQDTRQRPRNKGRSRQKHFQLKYLQQKCFVQIANKALLPALHFPLSGADFITGWPACRSKTIKGEPATPTTVKGCSGRRGWGWAPTWVFFYFLPQITHLKKFFLSKIDTGRNVS